MILSVCVLDYTPKSIDFINKFKSLKYYKKRESDTEGVRIHTVYVHDPDLLDRDFVFRYETENNFANVLNDGTQQTKKENSIGNDKTWLLESNGHDTIVEAVSDPESYLDTLLSLISKGYWTNITSPEYKTTYKSEIEQAARLSGAIVQYWDSIDDLMRAIDQEYESRVKLQRERLKQESLDSIPCGLMDL